MPKTRQTARTEHLLLLALLVGSGCRFDPAYRDTPGAPVCNAGQMRCEGNVLQSCASGSGWQDTQDCQATGKTCSAAVYACVNCTPHGIECQGQDVLTCDDKGAGWHKTSSCDTGAGRGVPRRHVHRALQPGGRGALQHRMRVLGRRSRQRESIALAQRRRAAVRDRSVQRAAGRAGAGHGPAGRLGAG